MIKKKRLFEFFFRRGGIPAHEISFRENDSCAAVVSVFFGKIRNRTSCLGYFSKRKTDLRQREKRIGIGKNPQGILVFFPERLKRILTQGLKFVHKPCRFYQPRNRLAFSQSVLDASPNAEIERHPRPALPRIPQCHEANKKTGRDASLPHISFFS